MEENAEAGTFGTILHKALETLYTPYILKPLTTEDLKAMRVKADALTEQTFREVFSEERDIKGKLLLQLEVLKVYVKKQISGDEALVKQLKQNNQFLTVLHLEKEWQASVKVPIKGEEQTVYIKGKIDRIDKCGNNIRILDYKTSVKDSDKFKFKDFSLLFENTDYHKQFQLFCYVWLLSKNQPDYLMQAQPGIIPFKMYPDQPYGITSGDRQKSALMQFNTSVMEAFENELITFVSTVFNEHEPFRQTDDHKRCEYCDYAAICNR